MWAFGMAPLQGRWPPCGPPASASSHAAPRCSSRRFPHTGASCAPPASGLAALLPPARRPLPAPALPTDSPAQILFQMSFPPGGVRSKADLSVVWKACIRPVASCRPGVASNRGLCPRPQVTDHATTALLHYQLPQMPDVVVRSFMVSGPRAPAPV